MKSVRNAILACDERKTAALGPVGESTLTISDEEQTRRVLSGFDLDYEEVTDFAHRAGAMFAQLAMGLPLPLAAEAAWTEGLLIGLFLGVLEDADKG